MRFLASTAYNISKHYFDKENYMNPSCQWFKSSSGLIIIIIIMMSDKDNYRSRVEERVDLNSQ